MSAPSGRRRGAVNYAEVEKDDTEPSDSDEDGNSAGSDDSKEEADGNYGGRVGRAMVKSKKLAGARGGMGRDGEKKSAGVERSYLGELPPVEKVVVKPAMKTKHIY